LTRVDRTLPLAPWVAVTALAVLIALAVLGERGVFRWIGRRERARRAVPDPARA
jgi:hypothetical protein